MPGTSDNSAFSPAIRSHSPSLLLASYRRKVPSSAGITKIFSSTKKERSAANLFARRGVETTSSTFPFFSLHKSATTFAVRLSEIPVYSFISSPVVTIHSSVNTFRYNTFDSSHGTLYRIFQQRLFLFRKSSGHKIS